MEDLKKNFKWFSADIGKGIPNYLTKGTVPFDDFLSIFKWNRLKNKLEKLKLEGKYPESTLFNLENWSVVGKVGYNKWKNELFFVPTVRLQMTTKDHLYFPVDPKKLPRSFGSVHVLPPLEPKPIEYYHEKIQGTTTGGAR